MHTHLQILFLQVWNRTVTPPLEYRKMFHDGDENPDSPISVTVNSTDEWSRLRQENTSPTTQGNECFQRVLRARNPKESRHLHLVV
ncbi:hypothetical protein L2E82_34254 [Cichorium intybus]|uniref:Uncharacterized protein n=1 Tax=Cichorium intybus TaxID=13427 RepID=A0ACB9BLZ3_CICIN|nr:hypothetical protein L2E82_34254 [Cichorium intybus]